MHHALLLAAGRASDAAVQQQLPEGSQLGRMPDVGQRSLVLLQAGVDALILWVLGVEHQLRVVAHLAQVLKRLEDMGHGVAAVCSGLDGLIQGLLGPAAGKVLVQLHLQGTQLAVVVLQNLGGQVLQHILLHPPQQEGQHLPMQGLHGQHPGLLLLGGGLGVPRLQDGLAEAGRKLALRAQEARHEEVEEGPQVQHLVLDRGAR
uniref:Uncharacterized protein n=1 Tax=Ixodes ricinus TaxID=34613 RepID=A0A6B0V404_IXORI